MLNILVLCTGNSCRSILLEGILNHFGAGRVRAVSAGSHPTGAVHPLSLTTLAQHGIHLYNAHSKSWDVFADESFDLVITVCDSAAHETCPVFPGAPLRAHWGVPDPAHGTAEDFEAVFQTLQRRAKALLTLPKDQLTQQTLQQIGQL
jgi:arsenate reductase (thioredoxin)